MRNFWAIYKKEMRLYFCSPIAYVVTGIFLVIMGYLFYVHLIAFSAECVKARTYGRLETMYEALSTNMITYAFFSSMSFIMLLLLPLLTMRLFAEEKRQGTFELLFTSPIGNLELVFGKFAACLTVFALMLLLTGAYQVLLALFGNPDIPPILTSYLGVLLLGAAFIAFGELVSTFTQNQVVAAALSFGGVMLFYVIGWLEHFMTGLPARIFKLLSLVNHLDDFIRGVVSTEHVVFYLSFIFLMLFVTGISLESIRWRE